MKFGKCALWSIGALLLAAPALADKPPACTPTVPTAKVSPDDQTVAESSLVNGVRTPTTVHLNGTPSLPGNDVTYAWTQRSGPAVTLSSTTDPKPTFSAPDVSPDGVTILVFRLTVFDCSGTKSHYVDTSITVTNVNTNRPPVPAATVAGLTSPYAVNEGMSVTMDASGSSDPDGDNLSYTWTQTGGTPVTIATDSTGKFATFTAPPEQYPNGETLTFVLTVSDGHFSIPAQIEITVQSVNQPPAALLSCPAEVAEGAEVTLDGSGSSDPDLGPLAYQWSQSKGVPNADLSNVDLTKASMIFTAPPLTSPAYDTMTFGLQVTDNGNLSGSKSCDVKVLDVTPPALTVPEAMVLEATSADGAVATFAATAHDAFDGDVAVTCTKETGTLFGLGMTSVTCSAVDTAKNRSEATFTVTVVDTTPPKIAPHDPVAAEATGPSGSAVLYASPETTDAVDGTGVATCLPTSGSTFALGETTVTCTAMDAAGNVADPTSFTVSVVDTTPPALTLPGSIGPVEGNTLGGATVTFATSASDLVDGPVTPACDAASGSVFPVGTTTVSCSAVDNHGNKATGSFAVTVVDTTPPVVTLGGTIADGDNFIFGSTPPAPTCTAVDLVSGSVPCAVSGYSDKVGSHTLTGAASDTAGNTGTATRSYTVLPWTLTGFYRPVEMGGITNTVKNGSTVPLKFEVFAGTEEKTGIAAIASIQTRSVACQSLSSSEDPVDALATGGTLLRYDATAGQFIFNWQTPKSPGSCYVVTATTLDGSTISANFKLK